MRAVDTARFPVSCSGAAYRGARHALELPPRVDLGIRGGRGGQDADLTVSKSRHGSHLAQENTVNVTRWMLGELQLTEEDTVMVKMDIEGAEWAVLHEWLAIPHMPAIVDELFVEVHYHHPSMEGLTWTDRFNHTLDDTILLLTDLRRASFYVHPWP
ncbi:unnamed protein product [Closterium sp. Naga37s-1]|nr:unnamed protein product [Closterium sp. Naga37s-1]